MGFIAMTPSGICTLRRMVAESPQPCGTRSTILYGVPTGACCCSSVTWARTAAGARTMASPSGFANMARGHDFLNMEVSSRIDGWACRLAPAANDVRRWPEDLGHLSERLRCRHAQRLVPVRGHMQLGW